MYLSLHHFTGPMPSGPGVRKQEMKPDEEQINFNLTHLDLIIYRIILKV